MAVLAHCPSKSALRWRNVCYKVPLCEYCQRQSYTAFAVLYIRMQKWFVVDVPILVKIWPKLTHPLQKTLISDQHSLVRLSPVTPEPQMNSV